MMVCSTRPRPVRVNPTDRAPTRADGLGTARLRGVVLSAAGGRPLGGAQVRLVGGPQTQADTAASGRSSVHP